LPPPESIYEASARDGALRQGEILSGLIQRVVDIESLKEGTPRVDRIAHPLAIVVSQDCDLDWDFKARNNAADTTKLMPSVLFSQVTDLETMKFRSEMKSDIFRRARKNLELRYHVLSAASPGVDSLGDGMPELGIDFKRYFTVPTDDVYRQFALGQEIGVQRRAVLRPPFREDLAQRFYFFQARVALPE
jgi:hypothetical protein